MPQVSPQLPVCGGRVHNPGTHALGTAGVCLIPFYAKPTTLCLCCGIPRVSGRLFVRVNPLCVLHSNPVMLCPNIDA